MKQAASILFAALLVLPFAAQAYESDVHFGLTKWLALKAGYSEQQADTIAVGNQRSDSGTMDSIELTLEYACLGRHQEGSEVAARYHFAAQAQPPASPQQRAIVAGSRAARRGAEAALAAAAEGKAESMLLRLGQGLHLLQDSWAYQGEPDTPDFADKAIPCSPELAWAAPAARGGWNAHRADLTSPWPGDVRAMAAATYEFLTGYAPIAREQRRAESSEAVMRQLDGFINASTKAQKRAWFRSRGIEDTSFLGTVSLPDGGEGFQAGWHVARLVPLEAPQTRQYEVSEELKHFFDRFFSDWLATDKPEHAVGSTIRSDAQRELAARLKLWRLRDHGAAAELAHAAAPFNKKQLASIDRLATAPGAYARYPRLQDAYYPLQEQGPAASPVLPYVIHVLPGSDGRRAIAATKLRHAPYDELGIIAEKDGDAWRAVRLISIVSH
ncbi:DUF6765 family protein [Noviherbaspirillum pedocola]|uniref:S1/P1 Nuclease n=1 Tax=Noviherbaspirillum pedocola TaxID=2801341 RepID=A0A934T0Q3_9BURK|nr:DUF6765 family protein [Noviherbaspirillum pedocola]MBK4736667.1 hypothetical protein [Noviherbaspirillum pedocola]